MTNRQSKTVFLNGLVVGEVPSTGNHDQDVATVRQFLRDKGLHRETTLVQAMFRQALSFATTASYLYKKDLTKKPTNGFSISPFVVNSAFSIELYIKTLAEAHGRSLKGHELIKLFDALPSEALKAIESHTPQCAIKWSIEQPVNFRGLLEELNHAFVEWRYVYEKERSSTIRIMPTIFVMECLHEACRASNVT